MVANFPEIMTIGEAAQYLRVSSSSLYKLAQAGRVPCQKVGRHWRFRREAIDRWLEQVRPFHHRVRTNKYNSKGGKTS